jgi:hypothetical protein
MNNVEQKRNELPAFIFEESGIFGSAANALITIGELLGVGAVEHGVSEEQRDGLHHAVFVIGKALRAAAFEIAEAAEAAGGAE